MSIQRFLVGLTIPVISQLVLSNLKGYSFLIRSLNAMFLQVHFKAQFIYLCHKKSLFAVNQCLFDTLTSFKAA